MTDTEKLNIALDFMPNVVVEECRDHYFGDREITLTFEGTEIGGGYLSRTHRGLRFEDSTLIPAEIRGWEVKSYSAILKILAKGKPMIGRNDTEGSDYYGGA